MSIKRRNIAGFVLAVSLSAAAGWYFSPHWLPGIGKWLDVGEPPRRVDYVMSLPGDEGYRPFVAAAMINLGLARSALIVQNEASPAELDGVVLPTSEIIRRVYQHCGIGDDNLIVLSGKTVSTAGDIDALANFLKEHPQRTVAIVTSDYHTRRSRWTFHRQLGSVANQIVIVSAPNGEFDFQNWWRIEDGFLQVIMEYIKLAAYLVVYGRVAWWLGAGIVVLLLWRVRCRVRGARCQDSGTVAICQVYRR